MFDPKAHGESKEVEVQGEVVTSPEGTAEGGFNLSQDQDFDIQLNEPNKTELNGSNKIQSFTSLATSIVTYEFERLMATLEALQKEVESAASTVISVLKSQAAVVEQSYHSQLEAVSKVTEDGNHKHPDIYGSPMKLASQLQTKAQKLRAGFASVCENANKQITNQLQNLETNGKSLFMSYSASVLELTKSVSHQRMTALPDGGVPSLAGCMLHVNSKPLLDHRGLANLQLGNQLWGSRLFDSEQTLGKDSNNEKELLAHTSAWKSRNQQQVSQRRETQLGRRSSSWRSALDLQSPHVPGNTDRMTTGSWDQLGNELKGNQHTIRALDMMGRTNELLKINTYKDDMRSKESLSIIKREPKVQNTVFAYSMRASVDQLQAELGLRVADRRSQKTQAPQLLEVAGKARTKSFIKKLLESNPDTNPGLFGPRATVSTKRGEKLLDNLLGSRWSSSLQGTPKS